MSKQHGTGDVGLGLQTGQESILRHPQGFGVQNTPLIQRGVASAINSEELFVGDGGNMIVGLTPGNTVFFDKPIEAPSIRVGEVQDCHLTLATDSLATFSVGMGVGAATMMILTVGVVALLPRLRMRISGLGLWGTK